MTPTPKSEENYHEKEQDEARGFNYFSQKP